MKQRYYAFLGLICLSLPPAQGQSNSDPFETWNRAMTQWNFSVSQYVFSPWYNLYHHAVPSPLRQGVSNFTQNLRMPFVATQALLQGNVPKALQALGYGIMNTLLGLGGLISVTQYLGAPPAPYTNVGDTLRCWGMPQGPYMVLPFVGPMHLRDTVGWVAGFFVDPLSIVLHHNKKKAWVHYSYALEWWNHAVETYPLLHRARTGYRDPYLWIRRWYLARRGDKPAYTPLSLRRMYYASSIQKKE